MRSRHFIRFVLLLNALVMTYLIFLVLSDIFHSNTHNSTGASILSLFLDHIYLLISFSILLFSAFGILRQKMLGMFLSVIISLVLAFIYFLGMMAVYAETGWSYDTDLIHLVLATSFIVLNALSLIFLIMTLKNK